MATEMSETTNSQLLINAIRQKYPDKIGQYFFKSCGGEWIVVLEKTDGTITTQSRLLPDDRNKQFAKYRADKLTVVDIIYKFNPNKTTDQICNTFFGSHTVKYIKGSIVVPNSFDQNIDKVCSYGIHFYERIEPAFYLELEKVENGKWTAWYDSGQKEVEIEYLNGKYSGKWTKWYYGGQIWSEREYLNGEKHGKWTERYDNGQIQSETEYLTETEYLNGEKHIKLTK